MTIDRGRSVSLTTLRVVAAIAIIAWTLGPLVWLVIVGLYPASSLTAVPPDLDPRRISLDTLGDLLADSTFMDAVLHSALAAGGTMVLCLTLASLAAYGLTRLPVPGGRLLIGGSLVTQMVPATVLAIPVFMLVRAAGLLDTVPALILAYVGFLLPYAVLLLRSFLEQVPRSLDAASRMDGASRLQTIRYVLLPVAAPGLAATAIFIFVSCWNEFLFALVLTSQDAKTVTVRLSEVAVGLFGNYDYGAAAAAALVAILPVVLLFVFLNRFMVRGLLEGSTKG